MDIYEQIIKNLKNEYESGATYRELSEKYDVSLSYIRELMNKIRPVKRISMEFFFKMFPQAEIFLNGAQIATGDNAMQVQGGVYISNDDAIAKILDAESLSAEEKIKVIKVLKK